MMRMDRRWFLRTGAAVSATLGSLRVFGQGVPLARLKVGAEAMGAVVPRNFVGLSYETQQLSDPAFFSAANVGLIERFRALSERGVLRLGGNTSDVGWWKPTAESVMPPLAKNVVLRVPPGERSPLELAYAVTPEAVRNLKGFLEATGWTCLYGINLGMNTPERAAEEAADVAKTLGARLEYFQLGNEPDIFWSRFRAKATWTVDAYLDEWIAMAKAIAARVPEARFGLPDVASNADWLEPLPARFAGMKGGVKVAAVSHHYYFTGPPSNPRANITDLLRVDERVARDGALVSGVGRKMGTAWRMTEGNSCYRGGKPGLSDVFAASLWSADYLLQLAAMGYAGVNLHGGDGQMVANSLGGRLPGDDLVTDDPATHPHPYYTPIGHIGEGYVMEPVFYGMKFAGLFAGGTMVPVELDAAGVNATAYAARMPDGEMLVAVINKDAVRDVGVDLPGYVVDWVLTASALDAKDVVLRRGKGEALVVKRGSAVVLRRGR